MKLKAAFCAIAMLGCLLAPLSHGFARASGSAPPPAAKRSQSGVRSHVECSTLHSRILARSVPYCVMLPPSYTRQGARRYPVSYFLHGLGHNEQSLAELADWGIYDQLLADGLVGEFVIIAPFGSSSFYIDSHGGGFRYEDFFLDEFLPAMERRYRIGSTAAQRGIMGISMGGYGALHYGFKYPQKFAAISALMPALTDTPPRVSDDRSLQHALARVFGEPPDPAFFEKNSPMHLARTAPVEALRRLTIYFDCGSEDRFGFERGTAELDQLLSDRGVEHEAHIDPGGHNRQFVMQHVGEALAAQSRGLDAK